MATEPTGPLAGLTVVDLSTVLAGPYCTMLLGDLGADVIKVEPPDGDATRGWGPPWVGDEASGTRTAAYYLAVNRNKRSLRLDVRTDDGKRIVRRLIERADVLVENFRVGGFARLGFDERTVQRLNDRLVWLSISGYGSTGPDASKPGYDFIIQAVSGLMSITGFPDAEGGQPTKVGVAIADVVTGLHAAVAVLAALGRRDRDPVDPLRGQHIEVSILQSTLAALVNQAQNAFVSGRSPDRLGNAHPNIVPYETFTTADGQVAVAVGSDRQWQRLCEALDLAALARDPRFATNGARVTNRAELRPMLAGRFAGRPTADWVTRLDAAEVPNGPITDILSAFRTDQARATDARVSIDHPEFGRVDQVATPFSFSATPAAIRTPPPMLGQHTNEILDELGFAPADVVELRRAGVV